MWFWCVCYVLPCIFVHVNMYTVCVLNKTMVVWALMYQKAAPCKSLYMIEIWPLHLLESWPWILVLCLAARIRGNLPQTHILLQEICAVFASALFQKRKTRLLLNCNLWLLTEREILCKGVIFFFLSFSFRVKSRSSWKAKKLTDIPFCVKKRLPEVKLNSWATWPNP